MAETTAIGTTDEPPTDPKGEDPRPHHHHGHHHHHHHHTHHPHQHQHHHRNLQQTMVGKGAEATGRRVLIGVDGSEHSSYALDWYLDHVWHHEDYVVLLNCPEMEDPSKHHAFQFDRETLEHLFHEEQDHVHSFLETFRDKLLKIGVHGKVRAVATKHVGHALVRIAEEEEAAFLVVGGRGKGTLRRTFTGSVSDYVVHHAHVPVLVCMRPASHHKDTEPGKKSETK